MKYLQQNVGKNFHHQHVTLPLHELAAELHKWPLSSSLLTRVFCFLRSQIHRLCHSLV